MHHGAKTSNGESTQGNNKHYRIKIIIHSLIPFD